MAFKELFVLGTVTKGLKLVNQLFANHKKRSFDKQPLVLSWNFWNKSCFNISKFHS